MSDDDISILQEIDEALRADKAHQFWLRYGKLVLAGCAGIVVLTAVSVYWKNHLLQEQMQQTHVMLQADSAAKDGHYADAAQELVAASKEWPDERAALVKLERAQLYIKAGERAKAIAALKEITSSTANIDETVRDSAIIRLYALTGEGDITSAGQAGRPFSAIALQMKAATLMKEGKKKEAAALLNLVIASAPPLSPEYTRASELLQLTGEGAAK